MKTPINATVPKRSSSTFTTKQTLKRQNDLLAAVRQTLELFISGHDPEQIYGRMLDILVQATESAFGFLDEVLYDIDGNPYKKSLALSDISWSSESHRLYEALKAHNLEFHNLDNLSGAPVIKGRAILANNASRDPLYKGIPEGHPPIVRYLGIPLYLGAEIIGMVGVANRPTDYTEEVAEFIIPLTQACAAIIHARRIEEKERKNLAALKAGEARYRRIAENISDVVWVSDLDLKTTYVSPSVERMLGESVEAHLQKSMEEKIPSEHLKQLRTALAEELEKEADPNCDKNRSRLIEMQHYRADGGLIWIAVNVSFVRDEQGKPIGLQGVTRDITGHKRMEETQRRLQERLSQAVEMALLGYWEYDVASDQFIFDDAFYKIYRVTAEQMGGYTMSSSDYAERFVHPEDRWVVSDQIRKALHTIEVSHDSRIEHRILYADGTVGHIAVRFFVVKNAQGKTVRTYGVNQDITARKKAEERAAKLQAQLFQAQKMESVGRLAGGVAHDFNNMLGVILGYSELALEQVDPCQPLFESLHEIQKAAERLAHLTRQLLAFARKQPVTPRVLDLNDKVEGMLQTLRRIIGEDIDLHWLPAAKIWPLRIDPGQIDQILVNLCVNARDAMSGRSGRVTIQTGTRVFEPLQCVEDPEHRPGAYVMLAVGDNGSGMDQESIDNLFEPFFTTKPVGRGTGLGLPTIYGIVKQNKGSIRVESEPGMGTTFRIYLPRHSAASDIKS